jgi:ABC-type Zn uptake system ZnuABC Zn-binding protein ZnuA
MTQSDVSASLSVTTGPIAGSTKIYVDGVPFRRVNLTNGEHLDLYDTSGPYTDPHAVIDLHNGLRITQDIRDAMAEKSKEFAEHGNHVYLPLAT